MSADIAVDLPTREGHPCGCFCFSRPSAHRLQISGSRWRAPCPTSSSPRLIFTLMIWIRPPQLSEASINDGHQAPDDPRRERAPRQGTRLSLSPNREEVIHVLAGTIEVWVEQKTRILGPGIACSCLLGSCTAPSTRARTGPGFCRSSVPPSAAWELRSSTGPARRPGTG
jgi:hypothetical protein